MLILHIAYCTLKYIGVIAIITCTFNFVITLKFIDSFNNCISFQVNMLFLHRTFHNKGVDKTNM